ncbi:class I SAM-dependent DNA methyltransferase [Novosphingobium sp. Leaf2]|uniref:class I SAM-dependent DNA methyltransferase n=1 Tax=Novosphingobium sp. Leaf2 TaxID=1735670 RepID=UPI0006F3D85A|nr:SAM-dependent methyltransferase [Novosphingobium sp. Leaf2]KQM12994.1 NodS family protein [Novosphingobium sp. Leaf2]
MSRSRSSLPPDYFEAMFQGTPDPWDLETSPYEQAKYAHTVQVLNDRTYTAGFEVGCAKGTLTARLAPLCASLWAIDVSGTALRAARRRCVHIPHVAFANMRFPASAPDRMFDLIVLSEVAYYWADLDIKAAATWIKGHLVPGGRIVLVHWTGKTDYPQSGDEAVSKLHSALSPTVTVDIMERRPRYRLDLWRRTA